MSSGGKPWQGMQLGEGAMPLLIKTPENSALNTYRCGKRNCLSLHTKRSLDWLDRVFYVGGGGGRSKSHADLPPLTTSSSRFLPNAAAAAAAAAVKSSVFFSRARIRPKVVSNRGLGGSGTWGGIDFIKKFQTTLTWYFWGRELEDLWIFDEMGPAHESYYCAAHWPTEGEESMAFCVEKKRIGRVGRNSWELIAPAS